MQDILLQNPVLSGANKKSGLSGKTSADRNKSILYHAKNRLKKNKFSPIAARILFLMIALMWLFLLLSIL
jgi:hypothetical protein